LARRGDLRMRFVLFVVCCLVGGATSSFAQSTSSTTESPAAAASLTPVSQSTPAQAAEHAAAIKDETPVQELAAKTAEPPATDQKTDVPAEQKSEQPAEQHAAVPAANVDPTETGTITPADKPTDEPAAQPAEKPDAQPAEKKEEKKVTAADASCPGHPGALGTSRVLTISPDDFKLLGTIQYKTTLPLKDHEVVLTFDDGPIPPYTNSILDTLASQCVKATYFLVGEMAKNRAYLVRRIYNEGHSIGTHTQHHPLAIQRMAMARVASEVNGGIASVDAALGNPTALSPFFRIPGLGRTNAIEHFLEQKKLITWSADIDTNDWWRGSTPGAIVKRAMSRLNAKGRGIILMHDIHPATALALPALLKELKKGGYRVVHVVAAGERPKSLPEVVASPIEKENWPRVLHAKTANADAAKVELRHRVKTAIKTQHHRRTKAAAQRRYHRSVAKSWNASKHKYSGKITYAADAVYKPRGSF
jgi:peptidoglycan/xylan/chitin deacetylase (PgdA/CDA1 family)